MNGTYNLWSFLLVLGTGYLVLPSLHENLSEEGGVLLCEMSDRRSERPTVDIRGRHGGCWQPEFLLQRVHLVFDDRGNDLEARASHPRLHLGFSFGKLHDLVEYIEYLVTEKSLTRSVVVRDGAVEDVQ